MYYSIPSSPPIIHEHLTSPVRLTNRLQRYLRVLLVGTKVLHITSVTDARGFTFRKNQNVMVVVINESKKIRLIILSSARCQVDAAHANQHVMMVGLTPCYVYMYTALVSHGSQSHTFLVVPMFSMLMP